ncbi:unnamed protein product [Darwinula stevensoni]|uniref:Uncharacterized protein n=1 Tax=Darwinula stevensoni TaxID=69355 RepID=A0A7R9A6D6_9CRUS|nr:unnamed protein product [Darwinula stevensoni]CAG0894199.1 unnamed protein product [Darwinula stevensoni]
MGIFRVFLLFSLASPLWGQGGCDDPGPTEVGSIRPRLEVTYLRNYGELVIALEQGHHVTAIFNSRLCTGDSEDGDPVMVVPLDPWSRQATTDGTMDFVTFNHQLIDGDGNFVLIAGSAEAATGNATAILVNINTMNASIVQKTTYNCKINEGAYFVQKRYFHPSESLTSYLQLRGALLNGEHVTSVGYGERCSNPFPGYRIAQGGSFHLQFYIQKIGRLRFLSFWIGTDDAGEEYILLEYSSLALFPEDSLNFLSIQMKVRQNGRVEIVNSAYDIQTWENEYPFADPLQCDIDVSVGFYRVPGKIFLQSARSHQTSPYE